MKSFTKTSWLVAVPVVFGMCLSSVSRADDPKPEPDTGGKITIKGLLDFYYQYGFNHAPVGAATGGRSFDVKNDAFSFSLAEVNITREPSKKIPIGFTLTGTVGKTADLVHATEPGSANTYKYLQQVYGTYVTTGKTPVTIDFGKFVTFLGLEVIESPSNDNYSRSLLFNYAIPFYHAGVRFSAPLTKTVTGGLYIVNGWNNVEEDNGGKSLGASLSFTPNPKVNLIFNYLGGDESVGAGLPANLNVQLLEMVGTFNLSPIIKLGANVDYATASKPGMAGGHWSGQAIYGRYQLQGEKAIAVRLEHFEDTNGLRTGAAQNINEATVTFEKSWGASFLSRLEFRHDHAGTNFFPSGGGGSKTQDTISISGVIKY
ncbi:MAG: outer membrane beta-barrel protein [Chthonomonadales bacterium]